MTLTKAKENNKILWQKHKERIDINKQFWNWVSKDKLRMEIINLTGEN